MLTEAASAEAVVRHLKDQGLTKTHSIGALAVLEVADLNDAKKLVHFNEAWAGRRDGDEAFHEAWPRR